MDFSFSCTDSVQQGSPHTVSEISTTHQPTFTLAGRLVPQFSVHETKTCHMKSSCSDQLLSFQLSGTIIIVWKTRGFDECSGVYDIRVTPPLRALEDETGTLKITKE